MSKLLLSLILLAVTGPAFGKSVHQQLAEVFAGAEVVEIAWKQDVEAAGLRTVKLRFEGDDRIAELLAHLQFESDLPQPPPPTDGTVITQSPCLCTGTHVIRVFRDQAVVTEISLHHATHLRSPLLNGGQDAHLTADSAAWLNHAIQWDEDIQFLQEKNRH